MISDEEAPVLYVIQRERSINMLNRSLLLTLTAFVLGVFIGCSGDDRGTNGKKSSTDENRIPSELVGTWTFQSVSVNDIEIELKYLFPWEPNTESIRIIVSSDGTYVFENVAGNGTVLFTDTGTFLVDGDTFQLSGTEEQPISGGTWAVSENQLILTATTSQGYLLVVVATKQDE